MRTPILASIFVFVMPLLGTAQTPVLRGNVVDGSTGSPLKGAHVRAEGCAQGAVSDDTGRFSVACDGIGPLMLKVTYVGYADAMVKVTDVERAGQEPLLIRLRPQARELPPVEVLADTKPEVVYQRADLHVGAYLANKEGLWVLVYEKPQLWHAQADAGQQVLRGARLHLLDAGFHERSSVALPADVHALYHDYAAHPVVEGGREAWLASSGAEGIELGRMNRRTLHDAVLPWTDSIAGKLIGNNLTETFPAFDHFARDLASGEDRIFCSVSDEHTLQLFRSQYKYMRDSDKVIAMDLALETGIDAEIIAGYMTGFPDDPYFHVPYAPLFVVNDTLCVFDHYRHMIRRFRPDLTAIDEVAIDHQNDRDWSGKLLQDGATGAVYVQFKRNARTWLRPIDTGTGNTGAATALTYTYPEEVQVYDGFAYYVYRPFGSPQKRTLYREPLR